MVTECENGNAIFTDSDCPICGASPFEECKWEQGMPVGVDTTSETYQSGVR